MKKVLVTGAAGTIGLEVIKYLLSSGQYEVTALDLKNSKVYKRLKRYRKRINIIYGDILDRTLIESLVKDHDYIIHLATCLPPLADYKKGLSEIIEYNGTENIVRAINYYNPACFLIFGSTTSLYDSKKSSVNSKISINNNDYYNNAKYNAEKIIAKKLKNYVILRFSLILSNLKCDPFIYNINKTSEIETITKEDAAYAAISSIKNNIKINKKILNIGGGSTCVCIYQNLLKNIIKYNGFSFNLLNSRLFLDKKYNSPVLLDSDESNKILKYRNDSLDSYYMRQKRRSKSRKVALLFGKPILWFMSKK